MDFRFAVCDDAPEAARFAAAHAASGPSAGICRLVDVFQSAQALLFEDAACLDYDVLILDIRMEGQSGLDLARQVRLVNRRVQIVFVTGYLAYVEKGYDVEALHYLI
jgi:two-component SAPR family response regulator